MSYHRHDPDDMSEFERQFADVHDPFRDARNTRDEPFDQDGPFDDLDQFDDLDDDPGYTPIQRSRLVRWTAIVIVASFALGGLSSVLRWF